MTARSALPIDILDLPSSTPCLYRVYELRVVGLQPASSVSLVDTDLTVEFLPSEEQEAAERRAEALERAAAAAQRAQAEAAEEASLVIYMCGLHSMHITSLNTLGFSECIGRS